jgi:hypothetical protein
MRHRTFISALFLVAAAALRGGEAKLEITVHVYNNAGVPDPKVTRALSEAGHILGKAGFAVNWVLCPAGCEESPDPRLLVFSFNAEAATDLPDSALGFALPFTERGNHAAAFLSKVSRFSQFHAAAADDDSILGSVVAHEIGHLLLRSNQHGPGIMATGWQVEAVRAIAQRRLVFTPAQARAMRVSLQNRMQLYLQQQQPSQRAGRR